MVLGVGLHWILGELYGWGSLLRISLPIQVFKIEGPILEAVGWGIVVASVLLPYLCRNDLKGPEALWLNAVPFKTLCIFVVVFLVTDLSLLDRLPSMSTGSRDSSFGDIRDKFLAEGALLSFAVYSLMPAVTGPVTEELIFRGLLYSYLRAYFGAGTVIMLTGALFALAHNDTLFYTVAFGISGMLYGAVREATGGTTVPIAAHVTHNIYVAFTRF